MSYYQLTFETAVRRQPKPVTIIRVSPGEAEPPRKAVEVLRSGGLIVFPTDEGYVVGCNALDPTAVQRLYQVTGAGPEHLVRFAASPEHAGQLTEPARPLTHSCPRALMRAADLPLAAAAVPPGGSPVPTAQHVVFIVGDAVDLVLDAGPVRRQPAGGGR